MATSTEDVDVSPGANWVELAGSDSDAVSGFITVFSDYPVLYRQGDPTPPDSTVVTGHWLEPASDAVEFDLLAGERAYARAPKYDTTVIVTLDG